MDHSHSQITTPITASNSSAEFATYEIRFIAPGDGNVREMGPSWSIDPARVTLRDVHREMLARNRWMDPNCDTLRALLELYAQFHGFHYETGTACLLLGPAAALEKFCKSKKVQKKVPGLPPKTQWLPMLRSVRDQWLALQPLNLGDLPDRLSDRLRYLLRARKMSLAGITARLGLGPCTLNAWLSGKARPARESLDLLSQIEEELQVPKGTLKAATDLHHLGNPFRFETERAGVGSTERGAAVQKQQKVPLEQRRLPFSQFPHRLKQELRVALPCVVWKGKQEEVSEIRKVVPHIAKTMRLKERTIRDQMKCLGAAMAFAVHIKKVPVANLSLAILIADGFLDEFIAHLRSSLGNNEVGSKWRNFLQGFVNRLLHAKSGWLAGAAHLWGCAPLPLGGQDFYLQGSQIVGPEDIHFETVAWRSVVDAARANISRLLGPRRKRNASRSNKLRKRLQGLRSAGPLKKMFSELFERLEKNSQHAHGLLDAFTAQRDRLMFHTVYRYRLGATSVHELRFGAQFSLHTKHLTVKLTNHDFGKGLNAQPITWVEEHIPLCHPLAAACVMLDKSFPGYAADGMPVVRSFQGNHALSRDNITRRFELITAEIWADHLEAGLGTAGLIEAIQMLLEEIEPAKANQVRPGVKPERIPPPEDGNRASLQCQAARDTIKLLFPSNEFPSRESS